MAISDRIESIEEHLRDDYSVLEVAGADLTNVNKNILNLKPTWQERLLYFINNGTDVVWNNWDKVTGEGTILTLNNTEEAPMQIALKGNTSQETTTGKNLANIYVIPNQTSNLTLTIANDKITISNNGNTAGYTNTQTKLKDLCPSLQIGDVAYLFFNTTSSSGTKNIIYIGESWSNNSSKTITQAMLETNVVLYGGYNETAVISNFMITKVNDSTYEPYTNGASPNPDYPQDIHVVSGDNSIVVCGKNLAPTNWASNFVSAVNNSGYASIENKDNRSCLNYREMAGYGSYDTKNFTLGMTFKENTQYTLSLDIYKGTSLSATLDIEYTDGTVSTISPVSAINTWEHKTLTSSANKTIKSIHPRYTAGRTYIDINTWQIEEGTTATTFEEYKGASYPINLGDIELCKIGNYQDSIKKSTGKNLFDKDSISNGFLDESGIVGGDTSAYRTSDFIPILPNTAYYKTTTSSPRTKYYDKNKQPLNTTTYWDIPIGGNAGTFTTPSNAYYFRFSYPVTGVNANGIMINEGSTALPYEPYGKVWYLNKQIGKVVLDGSESGWLERGNTSENYIKFRNANALPYDIKGDLLLISNYFVTSIGANNASYSGNAICGNSGNYAKWLHISIDNTIVNSVETFKTWLSTHNTTVYYALQTPTYTEITDSTLLSQLNALAKSYEGQTNITQVNNDSPFIINATALREMT